MRGCFGGNLFQSLSAMIDRALLPMEEEKERGTRKIEEEDQPSGGSREQKTRRKREKDIEEFYMQ